MTGHESIGNNGWLQGSIFRVEDHERLSKVIGPVLNGGARLILITHSCDLRHHSYEAEPFAEVIIARPVPKLEGSFTHGRNVRRLHIDVQETSTSRSFELPIAERYTLTRKLLEELQPDPNARLSSRDLRVLANWLGNRYTRTGLPHSFNERISRVQKEIQRALKPLSHDLFAIYLDIDPKGELPEDQAYSVRFYGILETDAYSHLGRRQAAGAALDAIAKALRNCNVRIDDHGLKSLDEITLRESLDYMVWDFDWVSLGQDPEGRVPSN